MMYIHWYSSKNYSVRYELSKMPIFCFLPCYFLSVSVAKRDVIGGSLTGQTQFLE